ncbi:MAG: DUF115 domain-containing protein [Treponema sp.]|jgi:hypothetical protein|nr:DUF115 domain-containing protein [Treponema sp.]
MIDEIPRLFAARRGFSVSYKGTTLLSTMDPAVLADRTVAAIPKPKGTLYFCPSPLFGYGLKLLLEEISPDSAILCVETDEKLMALSWEKIDEPLRNNPRFRLVQTGDPAFLCAFVREAWGGRSFRRLEILRLTGGWQLNPELYDSLADALRRNIAVDWGNAMTLVKLGRRYARNALRNLALLPRSSPLSAVNFGAAPVLVLGAGPSLDGVLKGLRAAFGDLPESAERPFRIICVDTGLSSLYEWKLRPDLVVALESQHWNLRDFIGLSSWEVPVAMDLSALPATGEILGAHPHIFFTPWTKLSFFGRLKNAGLLPETLPPLGSVGLSAVAIARRLSTGPVIVGGIDFSFSLDQSHTRSAPAHLERLRRQTRFHSLIDGGAAFRKGCFTVPSKTGERVRSNQTMKNYRELFQREFAENRRICDIAGSGLPLGLRTLTAEEAYTVLANGAAAGTARNAGESNAATTALVYPFVRGELESLTGLRGILTGEITAGAEQLERLLDTCDYLWAHFPDYAGAEGKQPVLSDLGFLKRVRAEIDPFIKLLQRVLNELG